MSWSLHCTMTACTLHIFFTADLRKRGINSLFPLRKSTDPSQSAALWDAWFPQNAPSPAHTCKPTQARWVQSEISKGQLTDTRRDWCQCKTGGGWALCPGEFVCVKLRTQLEIVNKLQSLFVHAYFICQMCLCICFSFQKDDTQWLTGRN